METMRVAVNFERCEGHGMCEAVAPEIFELDDEGMLINNYEGSDLTGDLAMLAQRAVDACPVAALRAHR
jgi:ferredoxin